MVKTRGLGRGLSALMGESLVDGNSINNELNQILIDDILPNPDQPRTTFKDHELEELTNSIVNNGVLQPILIRPAEGNKYQIIAGERRWRASKALGLAQIPAIIKDVSARESLELALIENIQREDLSPLEEAQSYKNLIDDHGYTQEQISKIVSKSRSHIANLLRLLNLPTKIKQYLKDELISLGHAKLLINHANGEKIADIAVTNKLNIREMEKLLKGEKDFRISKPIKSTVHKDENITALEINLSEALGILVKIDNDRDSGKISIYFENLEQLDLVVQKLSGGIV
jgi:ParB family chromosome partitioning protein